MTTPNSTHKSKEWILQEEFTKRRFANPLDGQDAPIVYSAMEEYASIRSREEAIGFANWHYQVVYKYINMDNYAKYHPEHMDGNKLKSTEELYNQYQKSKPQ